MSIRLLITVIAFGCGIIVNGAAIDNSILYEEPRISSSSELLDTIVDNCFNNDALNCLKEKVLNYLDTLNGISTESARSFDEKNIDKVIFERVARILNTYEFKVQLPETLFQNTVVTYRADRGLDFELTKEEGRGNSLKKKVIWPILLLLKLKTKILIPIMMTLIGIKAMKALILSKIAIKLVLGFIIYNLIQKLGGLKMTMMPMMPPAPEPVYGVPSPTTPAPYEPSSWEPAKEYGSPYARVWSEPSSAQQIAYSSYYPSSSSSSASSSSGSSNSGSSTSSTYSSYSS
ncbi:uncharacterized protein LOC129614391 [Condylostylus longicornis]|uniref:uncharacterized protein LOC129614391 n=1 Tax=Condylostylus longicornis TaxID=2530218 RepID=UPI00244E31DB|nr:uncharacterized protein LOC129614391 [Condylostylus longicornis]